jgi:hypothetical protein
MWARTNLSLVFDLHWSRQSNGGLSAILTAVIGLIKNQMAKK